MVSHGAFPRALPARRALLAAACALATAACGGSGAPAEPARPRSVLWIAVDTLRADRLGCYGNERPATPHIDALAARGTRFERAYSAAPWTLPSVATMLTGRMPSSHRVVRVERAFPAEIDSVPRRAAAAGLRTAAVVSNRLLARRAGFAEHFELFDDRSARDTEFVSTPGVARAVRRVLEQAAADGAPFFVFALFFDPHYEYAPHAGAAFAPATAGNGSTLTGGEDYPGLRRAAPGLGPADRERLLALYDDEVAFTDRGVGDVLAALDELGLAGSTLVAVTADHGEEILERGFFGHAVTLHEELVRVPLVLAGPGVPAGAVVPDPVSLVELGPALLELCGAEPPDGPTRLAALCLGERPAAEPVVFEVDFVDLQGELDSANLAGIVAGDLKLLRDEDTGAVRLYDLAADPGELRDLAAARPERAAELSRELDRRLAAARARTSPVVEREVTREERGELGKMGYVGDE